MKLEEGMYVRTKDGLIRKCVTVDLEDTDAYELDDYIYVEYGDEINWLDEAELEKYISKSSYNIIDLIEEGDYVNGSKVIDIVENDVYVSNFYEEQCIGQVSKKNIKSIVTKEQIESIKYEVE